MFESYAVSPAVGNVKNQGAELLEPIDANQHQAIGTSGRATAVFAF